MVRKILLRYDDICPTTNWRQWNRAKQMMDNAGVTALLGVVPDCQDPNLQIEEPKKDFWGYIKELQGQGYTIAMHGLHHQFELKADGLVTKNKISEFAGLPYEQQFEKIRNGKEILNSHGIETDVFFAPAHSYDDNTLKALVACGFKYVSDGYSRKPYMRQGIKLLPCRSGGIPRLKKNDDYVTAVIHAHEWVRKDTGEDWRRFKDVMTNHVQEIVSYEDFAKWECGSAFIQKINEKFYYWFRQYIVSVIFKIMKK